MKNFSLVNILIVYSALTRVQKGVNLGLRFSLHDRANNQHTETFKS